MAETARTFAEGDSVISTQCLIAPPDRVGGVRVELPLASRGTVLNVWPGATGKVYLVAFEIGEGGIVQVDVAENQIDRVNSHEPIRPVYDLPPLVVRDPKRKIKRTYVPTPERPHRWCKGMHAINLLLMCAVYGAIFALNPTGVGVVTVCFLVAAYYYDARIHGNLHWYPRVLGPHGLYCDESFSVRPQYTTRSFLADTLLAVVIVVLLAWHYYFYSVNPSTGNATVYGVLCAGSFFAWVAKTIVHHRAVSVTIGNGG
jgi:hypothetical protein